MKPNGHFASGADDEAFEAESLVKPKGHCAAFPDDDDDEEEDEVAAEEGGSWSSSSRS